MDLELFNGFIRHNRIRDAIDYLRQCLKDCAPAEKADIYEQLGYCGYLTSDMALAADSYIKAAQHDVKLRRQMSHFSSFLFCLHYLPDISPRDLTENIRYYDTFCRDIRGYDSHHTRSGQDARLRVGYLSSDWQDHAMADFLAPFVSEYDETRFQVFAYVLNEADDYTAMLKEKGAGATWRDLSGRSPAEAADMIHQDNLDILVDLGGHSHGGESLMIMAHKPAPVQISGLGWINTTGLSAIDYFITDEVCHKGAQEADLFSEMPLLLDGPQLCYAPVDKAKFELAETTPKRRYGNTGQEVIYGVFSNFSKITDEMLRGWDEILAQVKDSILVLKDTTGEPARQLAMRARVGQNIRCNPERIIVEGASLDYLACYRDVDIVLDTYPYTGGATVCEALYMGRPVIALKGDNHGRRFSSSILVYSGFADFVAMDMAEYIKKAVAIGQKEALESLQREVATRFKQSRLMQGKAYMGRLEKYFSDLIR